MTEALIVNAAIIAVTMLLLCTVAARIKDVSFIDAVWGGGMALLALTSWLQLAEPGPRATLIAAMAAIWGTRLALHLYTRWRASGEDPRYARMLGKAKEQGRYGRAAMRLVFGPQALLLYLTCLPAQLGVLGSGGAQIGPLAWAGFALWLVGIVFESVGDAQLKAFRADPASKGKVLDTRPVALYPPSQLFRRLLRVVGNLAGSGRGGARHCAGQPDRPGVPDLHSHPLVGQAAAGEKPDEEPPGLRGLCRAHLGLHPLAAEALITPPDWPALRQAPGAAGLT